MKTKIIEKIFERKIFTISKFKKDLNNKSVSQDVKNNNKTDSKYLEILKRIISKNLQNNKKKS